MSYLMTSEIWLLVNPETTRTGLVFSLLDGDAISVSIAGGMDDDVADCELFSSFFSFLGGGAVSSGGNVNIMGRRLEVSSFTCTI